MSSEALLPTEGGILDDNPATTATTTTQHSKQLTRDWRFSAADGCGMRVLAWQALEIQWDCQCGRHWSFSGAVGWVEASGI